jgi:hypothetical protein
MAKVGAWCWGAAAGVVGIVLLVTGCSTTVGGTAVGPFDPHGVRQAQLGDVLLPIDELNAAVGATDMVVSSELEEFGDHSDDVSDTDCLGAIFAGEDKVYGDTEWVAVRDQVAAEPDDDNDHWVQQTAVLYPGGEQALAFYEESRSSWQSCAGDTITISDGVSTYLWDLGDVAEADDILTQSSGQQDSEGWACQHAMSAVTNVILEAWVCGYTIEDEAAAVVTEMAANIGG